MPFFFNSGAGRIVSGARRPPPTALSLRLLFLKPLRLEIKRKLANRLERVKSVDLHPTNQWFCGPNKYSDIKGIALPDTSFSSNTCSMHLFDSTSEAYRIDSDFFNPGRLLLTQAMKLEVMDRGSAGIADIRESVSIVSLSCSIWIPDVDFQMQIVVDTSNEIGGDGDIPHPAIGGARRLQVPDPCMKHKVMIEAVDNHMPEIVVDTSNEIGGDGDIPHPAIGEHGDCRYQRISLHSQSKLQYMDTRCRFSDAGDGIAIGGARRLQVPDPCMKHKVMIEAVDNHMPEVGGLKTVILSDEAARTRNCKKIILERRSAPAFPFLIEMRERDYWVAHRSSTILVDDILELYNMMLIAFTLLLCLCWPCNAMSPPRLVICANRLIASRVLSYVTLEFYFNGVLEEHLYCGKQIGLNSWRRSSTRRIRTATEETLRQFCCCTFVLLLPLRFAPAAAAFAPAAAAVLLLLLLHFASADAAAALLLCCRCCCYALLLRLLLRLLLLQLRFANAAAVFCCCCSLLRGRNPMVLTGSLAWEGTNSHNCGLIISSIKTNSTKEISNHDQVTLDLGRLPQACYLGDSGKRDLRKKEVSIEELEYAQNALGEFGGNNRTGIAGTLHRISAIRNKNGRVVGLTCRLGRPVREIIDMTRDLLEYGKSIFSGKFGRPGVGKTTVIRGISHVLSYELLKRVIVVDTSNEIGGDGDIPHPAIGGARRLQVRDPCTKHKVMIEAVDNHMPEIVVDTSNEIGGDGDIPHPAIGGARRLQVPDPCTKHKVMIEAVDNHMPEIVVDTSNEIGGWIGGARRLQVPDPCTKHKVMIEAVDNHMPEVGGLKTVILSDEAARTRNCKKIILERRSAPAFPFLIEMRERDYWVAHRSSTILVDDILELYNMMLIAFTLLLCLCWPCNAMSPPRLVICATD
ncbi:UNVERIFIED_CONTAM: putative protein ycf45 [Sesamum calycinum]|uniref:Uncharacterized protein n=1 Tax=Sesamum calycinum TaxID=2727403 RepID=A0AAW2LC99_9LAMI